MEVVYVFLVFHKKGKYKVKEFDGEDELEDFLIKYLNKNKKYSNIDFKNCSLYELVNESIKVGSIILDERVGYGIVKVVSGKEFEDSCSYSEEDEYVDSESDVEAEAEDENVEDENVEAEDGEAEDGEAEDGEAEDGEGDVEGSSNSQDSAEEESEEE